MVEEVLIPEPHGTYSSGDDDELKCDVLEEDDDDGDGEHKW